ncbi:MAG: GTPase HflX [Parachlamydiales bacterium]|jgi:GTP-binding protein HflX
MENTLERKKALLIAAYHGSQELLVCQEHLDELSLLVDTYGVDTAAKIPCTLRKVDASTYFSKGKLQELLLKAQELQVDMIIIDEEINPSQQRNLEKLFGRTVMDRAEVILGVFGQRAQTKEARLQIELAQVKYQIPRLKRLWTHLSRQAGTMGGGGAYLKGEGEKQIELDKRILRKKGEDLQKELDEVRLHRSTQRQTRQRSAIPSFAIVGYTNAGKSTLLNALTNADVFTEDKLFATLDTTTRRYTLSNQQDILLIDTVGFIRKLPHLLVAAFKSTLEEALFADILLHVIDVSHPLAEEQAQTTFEVLKELNAGKKPIITILNKSDKPEVKDRAFKLKLKYPKCISLSALNQTGFEDLANAMIEEIKNQRAMVQLRIPQSDYAVVSEILREGIVFQQEYVDDFIDMKAEIPTLLALRLQKYTHE